MDIRSNRILIVDDDPVGARILEGVLANQDYVFDFAHSGEEALDKAAAFSPDLVLLDVIMPGMDGFEVCRRLRRTPEISPAPVVMVTELDDRNSRLKGIEAGADDFISKPLNREELLARVRCITRLNRYRLLLAERERFDWMVEHAADGYILTDRNDVMTYANPKARLYLGLNRDDWAPDTVSFLRLAERIYNPEPKEAWEDWLDVSPASARRERYLVRPESDTANVCWLRIDAHDQRLGDRFRRIVRLRNVTEHMASMREMRTFHSMLSHKLRTPLYHVQAGVEMLADKETPLGGSEQDDLLRLAVDGVRRLSAEIMDVLLFLEAPASKSIGGGVLIADLESVVEKIVDQLAIETCTLSIPAALRDRSVGPALRSLEWVLWEVLENSKKFHPKNTPVVEVSVGERRSGAVFLSVADNGRTLPAEEIARVWDPYYQSEKRFTGEVHGMGLGLSMAAVLLWQAGGSCRMYNRDPGPGVVVEFTLPDAG